jgi:hypothetical protein
MTVTTNYVSWLFFESMGLIKVKNELAYFVVGYVKMTCCRNQLFHNQLALEQFK